MLNEVGAKNYAQKYEECGKYDSGNGDMINWQVRFTWSRWLICAWVFGPNQENDCRNGAKKYVF